MQSINISYSNKNSVARVVFGHGKGNIMDYILIGELQDVLNSFVHKVDLKLIVFEGAGNHFSFGASVEEHKKEYTATMLRDFHQVFYSLRDLSIPTMAKISGQCLGGGLELALMCNFIFADKTAKLGQPEICLGVFPPVASILLPEKIGLARAEELLITGKTITSEEGKAMGLVNYVFSDTREMEVEIEKWIQQNILPKSASSLRYAVKASRIKFNHVLSNFLPQLESVYVNQLMNTHDANEGIVSFLEKKNPVWQNN